MKAKIFQIAVYGLATCLLLGSRIRYTIRVYLLTSQEIFLAGAGRPATIAFEKNVTFFKVCFFFPLVLTYQPKGPPGR